LQKHWLSKSIINAFALALLLSLLIIVQLPVLGQQTQWSKAYSGSQGKGNCVIAVDGGYVIAGVSNRHYFLAKSDLNGEISWWKTFQSGEATSVIQTKDGGYALTGRGDVNLIKTDSSGNIQWSKNITNAGQTYKGNSLCLTDDDGLALTGSTPATNSPQHDLTIRVDNKGAVVWANTYGIQGQSFGTNIIYIDDGFVLAANQRLYRLNLAGEVQWNKTSLIANSLVRTTDGGFFLASGTGSVLTKTNSEGNIEWSKTYKLGSPQKLYPAYQFFSSAIQSGDGGYIASGIAFPTPEGVAWIVKTDSNGVEQWNITANAFTGHNSRGKSIISIENGIYVFCGDISSISNPSYSDIWLVKLSTSIQPTLNIDISQKITNSTDKTTLDTSPTPPNITANPSPTVPEFPSLTIPLLLGIILTTAGLLVYHKKHKHNSVKKV
jgi:hypothetical protein